MITVKLEGAQEMVKALERMRTKAVPFALRNALNVAAFETRTIWQREIKRTFVARNSFTERSVLVERASINKLTSVVGSIAPYMALQETGGTDSGRHGRKPIPGPVAAGQAPGSKRTRLVRARFKLGAINLAHPATKGDRKQRNAIAIATAKNAGKRLVLLERPSGGKGIFVLGGAAKRPSARLLWNVGKASVHIKGKHTLQQSLDAVKPKLEHMLMAAFVEQLQRFNVGK